MEQRADGERSRRKGRWAVMVVAGVVAILGAVVGTLIGVHAGAPNCNSVCAPPPPPQIFLWNESATAGSAAPQQAFTAAMRLTPCVGAPHATPGLGGPARTTTVTWIVATPNYGLARIQLVCEPPARPYHLWLFELYRNSTQQWAPKGGYIAGHWSANPGSASAAPAWLPLPDDTYAHLVVEQPEGRRPAMSVVAWDAQTRLYVFGHIADRAIRPGDATTVTVDGHPGWMVTKDGLVTITAPLADGSTLFFSGTAKAGDVETLAADAFTHASEALEPLPSPSASPSAMRS